MTASDKPYFTGVRVAAAVGARVDDSQWDITVMLYAAL
jgi:hypothetical protein